jgi:DNA repair ATPase RecN
MAEIKIAQDEVKSALDDLKGKTEGFDTSNPNIKFQESRLDMLNEVINIEEKYYKAIETYKRLLLRTENEMRTQIDQLIEKDKELAEQIK